MPDQRYEAHRQTIGSLLSTTSPRIEVPSWQRSYSWTTEAIGEFWQDLIAFDAMYPGDNIIGEEYFLGSIVIVTGGATNLILDGQQRLATATILLAALRDSRRAYSADAATRLQNKYISDFNDATGKTTYNLTRNWIGAVVQARMLRVPKIASALVRQHDRIRGGVRRADRVAGYADP
jgi:uncharacterized protein with ParB-like and HNH nuclease domain